VKRSPLWPADPEQPFPRPAGRGTRMHDVVKGGQKSPSKAERRRGIVHAEKGFSLRRHRAAGEARRQRQVIACSKCSKENQDHYKFCLGCGAELPRSAEPKPFTANTPPQGVEAVSEPPAAEVAPAPVAEAAPEEPTVEAAAPAPAGMEPAPAEEPVEAAPAAAEPTVTESEESANDSCPQCGHSNPPTNRFCASCGYNVAALREADAAPTPAASYDLAVRLTALRADGSEAGSFALPEGENVTVGRDTGSIFAGDSYLSPRHATFVRKGDAILIRDEASLNGVYIKLAANAPWKLADQDVFRIGQEIIRYEALAEAENGADGVRQLGSPADDYIGRLALIIGRNTTGNAFPIPKEGVHCGRERGDILFSDDGYVSGLHCKVAPETDGGMYLTDVGSSNGTFARLRDEHSLAAGDILLMGQQLFRVEV
jgi:pSer/pThr/pTyr-binding forkhead associated (FHA) protein